MVIDDLAALCRDSKTVWQARGQVDYGKKSSESGNVQFRRSLYFVKALNAGETITQAHIRSVRPGYGAVPKYLDQLIGKTVNTDIAANTPVKLEQVNF